MGSHKYGVFNGSLAESRKIPQNPAESRSNQLRNNWGFGKIGCNRGLIGIRPVNQSVLMVRLLVKIDR